jgi:hypothetical protein
MLQQTAAAILAPRDIKALSAAAAAELVRSADEDWQWIRSSLKPGRKGLHLSME